ncbi:nucleoside hydrolase [Ascidiaceihabitans sp.]|uniref:nucleoside hydrolase n=1 Tax=Ascidiaceihabitans sp. TaxID=1872644 RepID=UPI003299A4A2
MKTILDTDPGVDDAMTFYYAHASAQTDLVAMTTIFGNVTVEDATQNALWLAESVQTQTPVYRGAQTPLKITPNTPSAHVHGKHGFGDMIDRTISTTAEAESAAAFLAAEAARKPGELTVCAIGPLTNIALALDIDPNFIANLRQLVIMGGSLEAGGNVTPHAEANFWNDPHAANKVLTAPGTGAVIIVGLDVTTQISFFQSDYDDMAEKSPKAGGFLKDIGEFYMRFYETVTGKYQGYLHDPAALIACEAPELFTMRDVRLQVITEGENIGEMVPHASSERVCKVCMDVDIPAVLNRYKTTMATLP